MISMQTPLRTAKSFVHPRSGLSNLLLGPKYHKIKLEEHLFGILFEFHPLVLCLTAMECVRPPCGDKQ